MDESVQELVREVGPVPNEFSDEEIVARMMLPMCIETVRCLEENIVDSAVAADMGLIWGLGFPPFRGGALRYIDTLGTAAFCELAERYAPLGPAYTVTDGLKEMAAQGRAFFD